MATEDAGYMDNIIDTWPPPHLNEFPWSSSSQVTESQHTFQSGKDKIEAEGWHFSGKSFWTPRWTWSQENVKNSIELFIFLHILSTFDDDRQSRAEKRRIEPLWEDRWRHKLNSQWLTDSIDRHSNRLWSFWKNISWIYSADGRLIQLKYGTNVFTLNREVTSPFLTHQLIDYRGSIYRNLWRI